VKLVALRCPNCGRQRHVRERERGLGTVCDACGAEIEVPAHLFFPEYVDLMADQVLAERVLVVNCVSLLLCCMPLAAAGWWLVHGAIGRSVQEDRPVEPLLLRARNGALAVMAVQSVFWAGWIISHL
jgi:hypothetical protein